jgi:hypothetical protein
MLSPSSCPSTRLPDRSRTLYSNVIATALPLFAVHGSRWPTAGQELRWFRRSSSLRLRS